MRILSSVLGISDCYGDSAVVVVVTRNVFTTHPPSLGAQEELEQRSKVV